MKCPVCKGKKGKREKQNVLRYERGCLAPGQMVSVRVFVRCENCQGSGEVGDGSNTTPYSLKKIQTFQHLFNVRNNWRRRFVQVYQDPSDESMLITVGKPFNQGKPIICREHKDGYRHNLSILENHQYPDPPTFQFD